MIGLGRSHAHVVTWPQRRAGWGGSLLGIVGTSTDACLLQRDREREADAAELCEAPASATVAESP